MEEDLARYCPECRKKQEMKRCPDCGDAVIEGAWVKPDDIGAIRKLLDQGMTIKDVSESGAFKCRM